MRPLHGESRSVGLSLPASSLGLVIGQGGFKAYIWVYECDFGGGTTVET